MNCSFVGEGLVKVVYLATQANQASSIHAAVLYDSHQ
jgi:hypothetical protein